MFFNHLFIFCEKKMCERHWRKNWFVNSCNKNTIFSMVWKSLTHLTNIPLSHLTILGNLTNQREFSYKVDLGFMTHDHELKVIFFPCTEFELIICKLQIFLRQNKCITISMLSLPHNKTFYLWFILELCSSKSHYATSWSSYSHAYFMMFLTEWYRTHIYWFIMCYYSILCIWINMQFSTFY